MLRSVGVAVLGRCASTLRVLASPWPSCRSFGLLAASSVRSGLLNIVGAGEHAGQGVVVVRRDRVELVVVAAGAGDGQAEQAAADRVDAVVPLVGHHLRGRARP